MTRVDTLTETSPQPDPAPRGRPRPAQRASRSQAGFTLIEMLVTVLILGILGAIAVPNLREALQRSRRMAAYASAKQLALGIHHYMLEYDEPPAWVDPVTLEPLVSSGSLERRQADSILRTFEDDRFEWYWGTGGWWMNGGYYYYFAFRPKGEDDPATICYLWDDEIWRWDDENGWHQPAG